MLSRVFCFFFFFLPIYCLLGPCPMSDITYVVSMVASSSASFVSLYISFEWLGLKHVSSQTSAAVSQLLWGQGQVSHLGCRKILLGWWVEVTAYVVELACGTHVSKEVWEYLWVCE